MGSRILLTCVPMGINGKTVSVDILVSPQLATQADVDKMKNWYTWLQANQNKLAVKLSAITSSIPLSLDLRGLVDGAWNELFAGTVVGPAYQADAQTSNLQINNTSVSMRSSHATLHAFYDEVMLRRPLGLKLGTDADYLQTLHDEASERHGLYGGGSANANVTALVQQQQQLESGNGTNLDNIDLVLGRLGIPLVDSTQVAPDQYESNVLPNDVTGIALPDRALAGVAHLIDRMESTGPASPIDLRLLAVPRVTCEYNPYAVSFAVTNGTGGLKWSVLYLPTGLTFDTSSGAISGSATEPGVFHAAITVTDSASPAKISTFRLRIPVLEARLPDGFLNTPYTAQLHAVGGSFVWSVKSGYSLPAGLSLDQNSGRLSGTPTATGLTTIVFNGTSAGTTVSRTLTVAITTANQGTLPNGVVGASYKASTLPPKGTVPNRWSVASGRLPEGLVLDTTTGNISGAPTQTGKGRFRVQMKDSQPNPFVLEADYSLAVMRRQGIFVGNLPPGVVGQNYSASLTQMTQVAYAFQITGGTLPSGLDLDPHSGILSGAPSNATLAGSGAMAPENLTVAALDGTGAVVAQTTLQLFIYPNKPTSAIPLELFSSPQLPVGPLGYAYACQFLANSSNAQWTVTAGKLPEGLQLDPNSGLLSGIARGAGINQFSVQVRDVATQAVDAKAFTLRIEQHLLEHVNRISSKPRGKHAGQLVPDIQKLHKSQAGLDFNQCITLLLNMPVLMKTVGLVLQGSFALPDSLQVPSTVTLQMDLSQASAFENFVEVQTVCTAALLPYSSANTLTTNGWTFPSDTYSVGCLELDAEAKKQVQFGTRVGQRAAGHANSTSFQTADPAKVTVFDEDVVHPVLPPSPRTGGLQVWQHNRQQSAAAAVSSAQVDGASSTPPPRYADDLISATAVDILHNGVWYPLTGRNEAYDFPGGRIHIANSKVVTGVRMAATRPTDGNSDQFNIDETIFNWRLGSLVAPPSSNHKYKAISSKTGSLSTQAIPWSKNFTKTISASTDIPSPLFGETYQVAMRPVYVTGSVLPFDDQAARQAMLPPFTFQRYELMQGPELISAYINHAFAKHETKTLMMVGSKLKDDLSASPHVSSSVRVVAPSRVSPEVARRHGYPESSIEAGARVIPLHDDALPSEISNSMQWSGKGTPYLPDPLCIGVIATVTDLNGNLLVDSNGSILPGANPVDLDYFDDAIAWPDYIAHFIELQRADTGATSATLSTEPVDYLQANFPFPLDKSKKIVCRVPVGQTVLLYLHPKLDSRVLTQHAFSKKTPLLDGVTPHDISMSDICRPTVLRMSHAVDRPAGRPTIVSDDLILVTNSNPPIYTFTRTPANTMNLTVTADALSTSKVEVSAQWRDQVDDPQQAKPEVRPSQAQLAEFHVEKRSRSSPPVQPVHLPFADARYRRLTMKASALSRFATCFSSDDQPSTDSTPALLVDVLATAAPAAPEVEMTLPTLHWETSQTKKMITRKRTMGLTLILNRQWRSSGNFEKLAVLNSLDANGNPVLKTMDKSMDDSLVSSWGFMPDFEFAGVAYFTQSANGSTKCNCAPLPNPASDAAIDLSLDDAPADPDDPHPVKQDTINYNNVSYPVCLYTPKYNEQDQQWYVNLGFGAPPAYGTVVRLIVARHQHFAVKGCEHSPFISCDFALLSAQRYITFKRPGFWSRKVTLTVHGYGAYDTSGKLISQIEVRYVRSAHGNFDWQEGPVLKPDDPTKYKGDVLWQGTVDAEFIVGSTILVREKEIYGSAEQSDGTDYRVVYSDAFDV
jgi:hypothetical protein